MAHYQPRSRVPAFAADVCSLCFRNDPSNERLLRIYCNNYASAEHTGVPPILVTWSEWRWALVPIRPLPDPHLLHGNYVRCNGPALCRGERCTFAHSNEELAVWNTLLDEKRQQGFAGPRMQVNSHSASRSRQDEIGFEGGPQSWPAFTESRMKSSYHERSKNPPSDENAKLDLTQRNYQSKFCSLLYLEEKQHIELLHHKCNHDYRITMYKRGRVPSWVRVHKESDQFSRYGCISGMSGDQIMYASQASECLFIVDQGGEQVCDAKILQENLHGHYDEMLIKFTSEEAGKLERYYNLGTGLCNRVFSIEFEVKHFYFDLLHDSLKSLSPHQIDKVVPPVSTINNYPLRSRSFPHLRKPTWYNFLKLDEQSQQPALEKVVCSNYQIPVLVSGAFGTGKTRLLAVATYQFIEEGKRTWTPTRVLLCCHHQVTADTFLNEYFGEMVYHETNPWEVTLVRLTRARYKAEKIEYYNLCLTNKAFREMFAKTYAQENYMVVVTTFATALNINDVVGDKYFTHILLDEAAQVREPEAVAPLCMASEKTKLVIAGDNQQVGPSILVLGNIPQHYGLGKSLLTRLLEFYNKHNLPVAVLNTNYRCHEAIVSLARSLFYSHDLKSCAELSSTPGISHPIWFVCSSLDKQPQTELDADPSEAKVLVDQLKTFFKDLSLLDDVCILANSRNQLHEIKDRLFRQKSVFIPAQFLPTYLIQGNEFKALFMSTTESLDPSGYSNNPTKSLCSPSVFNTAITRAKSLVVAVGNPYTLMAVEEKLDKSKQCWAKYLNQCFSANSILKSPGITDGAVQELKQFVKQKLNELPPMPSATPSPIVQEEGIESSSTHVQKRSPAPVRASSSSQIQANSPVVERPLVQSQQAVSKAASSQVK